ncbi:MAG: phage portal protein [Rikenellaceae bacterium]
MTKTKIGVSNSCEPFMMVGERSEGSPKYWRWGDDNLFPLALAQMSRRSTIHRRIINDKADYIAGKGFAVDKEMSLTSQFIESVNGSSETLRQLLYKLAFDKALFGNAFLEIVTDSKGSFLSLYHHDASHCRVSKSSNHILLHPTWVGFSAKESVELPVYPLFEQQEDGTMRSMIHYKDYEPTFDHYGVPPYIAGMNVSAIAYKTDMWNISRLENSFQMSGVMLLDDAVDSEAEAEKVVRSAQEKFGGKPGQVLFVIKDGSETDNSRFIPLTSSNDGDWTDLHDQAVSDIVIAHSWFRALSGLDYTSSYSSERILNEYEVALNTIILSEQEELMEPIKIVMERFLGESTDSLMIINRPPSLSRPDYMKVWEARKAEGLDYDTEDPMQQLFLAQINSSYSTSNQN